MYRNIIEFYRLIFGFGIETDQHTQFFQIYKPSQGISTPALTKKERLFTSLYDAIARTLMIINIRRNIPPTTKNFSLSVAPF